MDKLKYELFCTEWQDFFFHVLQLSHNKIQGQHEEEEWL